MVRAALSAVLSAAAASAVLFGAAQAESTSSAAVAETILWGAPIAAAARTRDLPRDAQERLIQFRQRERMFHTSLKPPPGGTEVERELFEKRVAIERVLFCLFPRGDIFKVAASYASDAEVSTDWEGESDGPRHEAAFIDSLLRDLPQPWLAPYLHLIAGHRKLCASQLNGPESDAARQTMADDARRQIAHARDAGQPLIRIVGEHLLATNRCGEP